MAGNSFGSALTITTFGESHGPALGVVMDGLEPGFTIDMQQLSDTMDRRRPGANALGTKRNETDSVKILSGVLDGKTTGAPLAMIIENQTQRSGDYEAIKDVFRPGHADWTWQSKFGIRDHRGGGRSSGRETAARVAAGAIALQILGQRGIHIQAGTVQVGNIVATTRNWNESKLNPLSCPDSQAAVLMTQAIESARKDGDSVGGMIECIATGLPAGLGEPVFDKIDAKLAHAMLSIGAVKGIEFGDGFACCSAYGSQFNDPMDIGADHKPMFCSNHSGGVLGGMTSGAPLLFRVAVKPTPSISLEQQTIDTNGQPKTITVTGRHDPCICPRAVVVVQSMTALVILDAIYSAFGRCPEQE